MALDMSGAAGGDSYLSGGEGPGSNGGRVQCTLATTPGSTLYMYVGGAGSNWSSSTATSGGWNGGAIGQAFSACGGGASDIRYLGSALANRIVVAGGGGGGGDFSYYGGAGGGLTGGTGDGGACGGAQTGPACATGGGTLGTLGNGGYGTYGGGGGGYYGGNGGYTGTDGGGGGGSSYTNGTYCTGVTHTQGYSSATGNGSIKLTYTTTNNPTFGINALFVTAGTGANLNDAGIAAAATASTGYLSRMGSISPITLYTGGAHATTLTWGTATSYQEAQVWVDFNNDGIFASSEEVTSVLGYSATATSNPTTFNINIPSGAATGTHMMRVRGIVESASGTLALSSHLDPCLNQYGGTGPTYGMGDVVDYLVNVVNEPSCTGTPTAGTAVVSPSFGNASTSFTATLSGYTLGLGITFQWQDSSAATSGSWANISGATNTTYTFSGMTQTTYYRCNVSCSFSSSSAHTSSQLVFYVPAASCTPTWYYEVCCSIAPTSYALDNVHIVGSVATLNDGFTPNTAGYLDRTTVSPLGMAVGGTYACTMTYNAGFDYYENSIWIDFNNNGTYETTECVSAPFGTPASSVTSNTGSLIIPIGAPQGYHRMRVRNVNFDGTTSLETAMDPCADYEGSFYYYYGCAADYVVNLLPPPSAVASPTSLAFGTTAVTSTTAPLTFSVSATNLIGSGNLTITSPSSNFTVSTDGVTYGATALIPFSSATLSATTVYVQFSPTAATTYSGNVTITGGGLATAVNVAVSGTGSYGIITPTPSSLSFGTYPPLTMSPVTNISLNGSYLVPTSGTGTITATYAGPFYSSTGSATTYSFTFSGGSFAGQLVPVYFEPTAVGTYTGTCTVTGGGMASPLVINLTGNGGVPCSGTPSPAGTAVCTPSNGTPTTSFTLTISGGCTSTGLTYQWQSSPDGSTWSNITGATTLTYGFTGVSANTYFQCITTCTASGLSATSSSTEVLLMACLPTAGSWTGSMQALFNYTGAVQTYTVPTGISSMSLDMSGAAGGDSYQSGGEGPGSNGGRVQATLATTPGSTLYMFVGGAGSNWSSSAATSGGWTGGAIGEAFAACGGGASDIRYLGSALANRIAVAGGGGGGGDFDYYGGAGGGLTGGTGDGGACGGGQTGPACTTGGGTLGTLGNGGYGTYGGGGGGYYGGNGGYTATDGGGGGGSSYTNGTYCTAVTHTQGYTSATGNGVIKLTYTTTNNPSYGVNALYISAGTGANLSDAGIAVAATASTGYLSRMGSISPITLYTGGAHTATITWGTASSNQEAQIWIDFNNDGTFASSEEVTSVLGYNATATVNPTTFILNVPSGAATGTHMMRVRGIVESASGTLGLSSHLDPCLNQYGGSGPAYGMGDVIDYLVTVANEPTCSGTPTPGTAVVSPSFGNASTSFTASVSGYTLASGISFQWQDSSSATSGSWVNVAGATSTSYTFSGMAQTTYYRCNVSCSFSSSSAATSSVLVFYVPAASCTPTWYYEVCCSIAPSSYAMNNVKIVGSVATLNDGFTPNTAGYQDRTTVSPLGMAVGGTYACTMSYNSGFDYYENSVWIDFNNDGTYQTTECVSAPFGTPASSVTSNTGNLIIPIGAPQGYHRMRVRNVNFDGSTTLETAMDPCADLEGSYYYYYGCAADYVVNLLPPPAATASPTTLAFGTVTVTSTSAPLTFSVSATNLVGTGNLTITAPSTYYKVSSDGITYGATALIPYSSATLSATTVYVEFSPTAATTYTGNVTITGGGLASAVNVAVSGTGSYGNITPTPSSLSFGTYPPLTMSPVTNISLNGAYLTPTSGTGTITATYAGPFYSSTGSATTYSFTFTGGSFTGQLLPVYFEPTAVGTYTGTCTVTGGGMVSPLVINLTGNGGIPCSGTPSPAGTASCSPIYGTPTTSFTLTLAGGSTATGLTYQWQSSPDGTTWSNIPGATTLTYGFVGVTANTYFQCITTCTASSLSVTSASTEVLLMACEPTSASWAAVGSALYTFNGSNNTTSPGTVQSFVVPTGVTSLTVDMAGAEGGYYEGVAAATGGLGGRTQGTLAVTPGNTLYIYVGHRGDSALSGMTATPAGGSNSSGGAVGGSGSTSDGGSCGGGATDIRTIAGSNAASLSSRLMVAGGGGGGSYDSGEPGGSGGGLTGGAGNSTGTTPWSPTNGGTQSAGGVAEGTSPNIGSPGGFGYGGAAFPTYWGSGGGGGWFGGGGCYSGSGGGGSSYYGGTGVTGGSTTSGYQAGDGYVKLLYSGSNNTTYGVNSFSVTAATGANLNDAGIAAAATSSTGYLSRMGSISPITLYTGFAHAASITWGTATSYQEAQVWIDFNNDGTFASSEEVTSVLGYSATATTNPLSFYINVPSGAATGTHMMRIRGILESPLGTLAASSDLDPCLNQYGGTGPTYSMGDVVDYYVTVANAPTCSGSPAPGTASISPSEGTTATTFNLAVTGYTLATGITYQWQDSSSATGGSWTNITGATNVTYAATGLTTKTWYRMATNCSISGLTSYTATMEANYIGTPTCTVAYYEYTTFGSGDPASMYAMNNFTLIGSSGTMSDPFTPNAVGYLDRTSVVAPVTLIESLTYATTIGYTAANSYMENSIWIDFNDDGTFETSECVSAPFGTPASTVSSSTGNLIIPSGVMSGIHRMRVRNAYLSGVTTLESAMDPCLDYDGTDYYYWGSTADYTVNIVPLTACSGTPSAGTANSSATTGCAPFNPLLSLTGATIGSGLTYQWKSSTDGITYSNVTGATNATYTPTVTVTSYYECFVTCTNSSLSGTSTVVTVNAVPSITGGANVCLGSTVSLADAYAGGTWSSSATTVATVNPSGVVTGIASGTFTVSYVAGGCTITNAMAVNPVPTTPTFTPASPSTCIGTGVTVTAATTVGAAPILSESWENGVATTPGTTVDGWTLLPGSYTNGYATLTSTVYPTVSAAEDGTYFLMWNSYSISANSATLASPVMNLPSTSYSSATLSVWVYRDYGDAYSSSTYSTEGFTFYVNSSQSLTGATTLGYVPRDCAFPVTGSLTGVSMPAASGWKQYTFAVPTTYGASTYLMIYAYADDGDNCNLDNVKVTATPIPSYTWSGAGGGISNSLINNPSINPSSTGANVYSVVATAGSCSSAAGTVSISVNPLPTIAVTPTTGCTGVPFTASGASTYTWAAATGLSATTGATVTATPATATTYTVTGTSTAGCVNHSTILVNLTPVVTATVSPTAICQGSNVTLSGSSSVGGVTYAWSGPSSFTNTNQNPGSVVSTTSGAYTLTATNLGCSSSGSTVSLAVSLPPIVTASVTATDVCSGTSVTLNGANTGAAATYSWAGPSTVASTALTGVATVPTATGTYTLTAINGTCTRTATTATVTMDVAPVMTATVSPTDICQGGTVTLTGTNSGPSASYSWAGPSSVAGTVITGTTTTASVSGVYTVTAINGACTRTATTAVLTVDMAPVVTATVSATDICTGSSVTLTGSNTGASGSYSWSGPSVVTSTVITGTSTVPTSNGAYTLTATNGACTSTATTAVVTVDALPSLTVGASPLEVCFGGSVSLSGSDGGTGAGTTSYSWAGPTGFGGSSALSPGSIIPATGGAYTLTATNGACTASSITSAVTVDAIPTVTATASVTEVCAGNNTSLSGTTTSGSLYSWSGPAGYISSLLSPGSMTPEAAGAYSLTVVNGLCTVSATSASVSIDALPTGVTASASPANMCAGYPITLTATATGAVSYSWSGPGGYTATDENPAAFGSSTVNTGAFTVSAINGACTVTATSSGITVDPPASLGTISATPATLCVGGTITLANSAPVLPTSGSATYAWEGPAGVVTTMSGSLTGTTAVAASTSYSGVYTLTSSFTEAGCTASDVYSAAVAVASQATGSVSLSLPSVVCTGYMETISTSMSGGSGSATYTWSGPGIVTSTTTTSGSYSVNPVTSGAYTVIVNYSDAGCNPDTLVSGSIVAGTPTWLGGTSNDWNTGSNWSCGSSPLITDSAWVPGGTTFAPTVLTSAFGNVNKLTIGSGVVVTLQSGATLNLTGSLANSGTITGAGTLVLEGSAPQAISGIGSVGNIQLNNAAGAGIHTASDTMYVTGDMTLTSGNFATNGSLVLAMSDDPIGDPVAGRIATITGGSISGKVIDQQYLKGGRRAYRFWGTPFVDSIPLSQLENYIDITGQYGAGHGFTFTSSNAASAFWYHTTNANSTITGGAGDPGWKPFTWCVDSMSGTTQVSADSNMVHRFEGYRLFVRGTKGQGLDNNPYTPNPVTVRQWGTVNTGNMDIQLQRGSLLVSGAPAQDYNQKSNPYPSPVDIGTVVYNAMVDSQLYQPYIYVWNAFGATAGMFVTVNETSLTPYVISANASYQVRAKSSGAILHFTEGNKSASPSAVLLKASNDVIALNVYDENYHLWDMFNLKFTDAATEYEDNIDAGKAVNPDLNFYSWSADHHALSTDLRPFSEGKVIPMGLTTNYNQNFIIKVDNFSNSATGGQLYLHDKLLEKYMLLSQGAEYSFAVTKDPATQGDNRFELGMEPEGSVTATTANLKVMMVPNPATSGVNVTYSAPKSEKTSVRILTVEGVCVLTQDLGVQQSGSVNLSLDNLASGVYMVEFTSGTDKVVQRLVKE